MFYSKSRKLWMENTPDGRITAKTKDGLKEKLKEIEADKHKGRTFEEAADAWETTLEKKVEETTAGSYSPHVRRAKEFFSGELIKDVTPDEVQAYVDHLVAQDYAKDTVRRGLVVVNKIFKYEITRPGSEVRYNPCAAVEIPRGLKQTRREPPTEKQILKVTPDSGDGLFAWFLLCTGLRPSELLALRWEDIDRKNKTISIRKAATYLSNQPVVKDRTKTKAGTRMIPLVDALDAVLPDKKTGYVFGGDKPWTKTMQRKRWLSWCRRVGLAESTVEEHVGPNKHKYKKTIWRPLVTPYQFRHEYASMLEELNISEFDAQHLMGHASIVTTKDKYTHYREQKLLRNSTVSQTLNKKFDGSALNSVPDEVNPKDS